MVAGSDAVNTAVEDWDRTHSVNVRAPWLWSKHVIPHMRSAGGGAIVFTGSTSGMVGYPGVIAYTSSKGGLMNLTRSLALELATEGITVNTVSPGHIDTPLTRGFFTDPSDPEALEETWRPMPRRCRSIVSASPRRLRPSWSSSLRRRALLHRRNSCMRRRSDGRVTKGDR